MTETPEPTPDPVTRAEDATPLDNDATAPATGDELQQVAQPDPDYVDPVDVDPPTGDDDDFEEVEETEVTEDNYESYLPPEEDAPDSLATDPNLDTLTPEAQSAYDDAPEPEPQPSYEVDDGSEEDPAHDE